MKKKEFHGHVFEKGVFVTSFNTIQNLKLTNWHKDSAPEYLWIALIICHYGREIGIQICCQISKYIRDNFGEELSELKFSLIDKHRKHVEIYSYFSDVIEPMILDPLCLFNDSFQFKDFNEAFNCFRPFDERVSSIDKVMEELYSFHSQLSTDVNFILLWHSCVLGKLKICDGSLVFEALVNYPKTDVNDERMSLYRPQIRSCMQAFHAMETLTDYTSEFWKRYGEMKNCKCIYRKSEVEQEDLVFSSYFKRAVSYYNDYLMNVAPFDEKALVLFGMLNYSYKIYREMIDGDLGNSITGRLAFRTILENYILTKYLLSRERGNANIWKEYQSYGSGRLKLILERHKDIDDDAISHVDYDYLEFVMRDGYNEAFLNMDTRYFNNENIREKFLSVNESGLYNAYDYDSLFEHCLWGQIRESALLKCTEPSHDYHWILDEENVVNLKSVINDAVDVLTRHIEMLKKEYDIPEEVCRYDK